MSSKAQPCQHASYCPRRMRDGDHIGCADQASKRGCEPSTERPEFERLLAKLVAARADATQPYCRRCGADVKTTAWRCTERFMARCACGSCDVVFPVDTDDAQESP